MNTFLHGDHSRVAAKANKHLFYRSYISTEWKKKQANRISTTNLVSSTKILIENHILIWETIQLDLYKHAITSRNTVFYDDDEWKNHSHISVIILVIHPRLGSVTTNNK